MRRALVITAIAVLAVVTVLAWRPILAQGKQGPEAKRECAWAHIPKLTEEQKQKIEELRTGFLKEVQPMRNQLRSERFALLSLLASDKPDQKAINAKIDALAKLRAEIEKKAVAHRMQVRNLLTDEQKAAFDARPGFGARWLDDRPSHPRGFFRPMRRSGWKGHCMPPGECPMDEPEE